MISNIHFPKPNLKINTIASIFIILTIIIDKNFYGILPLFLLLLVVIYVVVGPLYLLKV
jgi:hypothetical protein